MENGEQSARVSSNDIVDADGDDTDYEIGTEVSKAEIDTIIRVSARPTACGVISPLIGQNPVYIIGLY